MFIFVGNQFSWDYGERKSNLLQSIKKKCKQFKKEDPIRKQGMHSITSVAPEAVVVMKKKPVMKIIFLPSF